MLRLFGALSFMVKGIENAGEAPTILTIFRETQAATDLEGPRLQIRGCLQDLSPVLVINHGGVRIRARRPEASRLIFDLRLLSRGANVFDRDRRKIPGTDQHFYDREGRGFRGLVQRPP